MKSIFVLAVAASCVISPAAFADDAPRQTLTGDWFGYGQAMRDAGLDLRVEYTEFFQGLTKGSGDKGWVAGGKFDVRARLDLSKFGFWNGLSVTAQGNFNNGRSLNGVGGDLLPQNIALFTPGIRGADANDVTALFVTQRFGNLVSVDVGKLNLIEVTRSTPLRGGGGTDTFWNVNLATPITGLSPPSIYGAMVRVSTQPVSYSLTVFDSQDATNTRLFSNLFQNGVNVMGTATYRTEIAGRTGFYGIRGVYSTMKGTDFSDIIQPPGIPPNTKRGAYYYGFTFQQYLVQDPANPARGWGVFGEIARADGNPNTLKWSTYVGIGGNSLIPGRPDDRFGVAYFHYGVSPLLKSEIAPVFPLTNESGVEIFYDVAVTKWFRVAADVQFIRPASASFPRSTYAGLRTYINF